MTYNQLIEDLKQRKFKPIYFLMGEESFYIDKISNYFIGNVLKEEEKAFNLTILYGKDVDAAAVINAAKRFPMMSEFQLIVVREAQNIKNIDDLVYYVTNPLRSTILVIDYKYKKLDKRKKLYKELEKQAVIFESDKLYDSKIPDWITQLLQGKGYNIQPPAALLLTEYLGNDLQKIEMELDKLVLTIPAGDKTINTTHIEENIGISKEYNNYELHKALVEKDSLKAFRITEHFGGNQKSNPLTLTLTSLYFFFNKVFLFSLLKDKSRQNVTEKLKINAFFIPDYQKAAKTYPPTKSVQIIRLLRECDLRSKGVDNMSATPYDLLKELVYKILSL
jgi:DNA polymerase III subunit delta